MDYKRPYANGGKALMVERSCCVTGHREIPIDRLDFIKQELDREIRLALMEGYRTFLTGFAKGVDILFAECVSTRVDKYPEVFLEAVLPYPGVVSRLSVEERVLLSKCNGIKTICEKYQHSCFFQRNRYMVLHSKRVIAVYDGRAGGGTLFTMDYARSMGRELRIIEL